MNRLPLIAAAALFAGSTASATELMTHDRVQMAHGKNYVCTGVSKEARENPAWGTYPAKLMFSTVEGDYVADVDVVVRDRAGAVVFEAQCQAPWLLIDLAPGRYQVTAVARGVHVRESSINVSARGQNSIVIQFPGINET